MNEGGIILQEWVPLPHDESHPPDPAIGEGDLGDAPLWNDLDDEGKRQSAVVVAYTEVEDRISVLCVERSTRLRRHAGQLAFPGGAREHNDSTPMDTAFRECHEELGLFPGQFRIEAMLPKEYAYSSDFVIYPFVAFIEIEELRRCVRPDPVEISSAFLVWTDRLRLPPELFWGNSKTGAFMYPVFRVDDTRSIWGATAKILWKFLRNLTRRDGVVTCP
jgi:8-oxo-dGTP pyrophosphatase MutT (NUDIX family)